MPVAGSTPVFPYDVTYVQLADVKRKPDGCSI